MQLFLKIVKDLRKTKLLLYKTEAAILSLFTKDFSVSQSKS